ncbi:ABC transporter permease [Agrobacterium sp. ICMP 6402]|uniref:ABC transporter permease n=1 Tax=Agrobacterium sp. ICMP 6402 TaxID=2292443 RepID=UPI001295524E|nr:ABC transporter permease [Agrobacterium sp. ICMP 6402]MQB12416.1 ABC transporter permease [Agrobacterium sp. ICMP 6402]
MNHILLMVVKRVALGVVTLIAVSMIAFLSMQFLPGDFATQILGQSATPEAVAGLRDELGLNDGMLHRYAIWIGSVLQGDFGTSFVGRGQGTPREVVDLVLPRLQNSLFLASFAASIAIPLALVLGVLTALWRNTVFDRVVNATTLVSIALPEFFVAYSLILVLSIMTGWFPSLASVRPDMPLYEKVHTASLPALTLVLVILAHSMRMTRASIIGLLGNSYVEMARLKGLSRLRTILRHVLPNAWAPIANIIALNLAYLIVGVVVVEVVFVYPGLGQLMVDSVRTRDMPVIQACILLFSAIFVLLNLLADIVSIATNPRLLHPR